MAPPSVNVHAGEMATDLADLLADLEAEQGALRDLLVDLDDASWALPTPAPGWTVLHQVRHLAHGEELGRLAATDPDGFLAELTRLMGDLDAVERTTVAPAAEDPPAAALARWQNAAAGLRAAVSDGPPEQPIGWVTGPMSRASFLTARLMETFAHGHDIADALGRKVVATDRLRHVAHLGVATRRFAFANRGIDAPTGEVRVELTGPDGAAWSWGPEDAPDRVTGSALDFCRLVTQRRHRDDTDLRASGADAERWLAIAQAFAGPPTDGRPPAHR
jgi:uncharacterized protein (TIGR03084 family)